MKIIHLDDQIGGWFGITAQWVRRLLPKDKAEEVKIVLNTPGGDVFEGFKIYQLLSEYTNVTVEIGALVASAGTYAILSAKKVIARSTSTMMIHKAWGVSIGNTDEMNVKATLLKNIDNMIAEAYAKKTNGSKDELLKAMKDETWLVGGSVIKEFGLADEVVGEEEISDEDEMVARTTILASIENYRNEAVNIMTGKAKPEGKPSSFNLFDSKEENLKTNNTNPEVEQAQEDPKTEPVEVDVKAIVAEERSRIMALITVSAVKLTPELENAIKEGSTKEAFCVALVEANMVVAKTNTEKIGEIKAAPKPSETVPTEVSAQTALENQAKAIYEAMKGKK